MKTWVLRVSGAAFDVLMYRDAMPSVSDQSDALRRAGLSTDAAWIIFTEKRFDGGGGKLPGQGVIHVNEARRQERQLAQLWRDAEAEHQKDREHRLQHKRAVRRSVQDSADGVRIVAPNAESGAGGNTVGTADQASAGDHREGAGEKFLRGIINWENGDAID